MNRRQEIATAALDALSAGVLVVADGHVELANPAAARILARTPAEVEGAFLDDLLAPADRDGRPQSARDTRPDIRIALPGGGSTELGFTMSELDGDDAVDGRFVVLFQEITGVRQLRRERDRLIQLAAVGEALPSVLHELRNPIAAMTGLLELLLEEPDAPYASELHAILTEVRRMTLTLQGVGGLVRSARAERPSAIDAAVRDACCILGPMARRKGVELRAIGPDLPPLRLDREVLSGVVFNLVKNAIDACDEGDLIEVDAHVDEAGWLALSVTDDGPGMTPDVEARCRELFFTSKEKGSGVGLALCQRVADVSEGRLDVVTAPGRGTRVTLRVPFADRIHAAAS